MTSTVTFLISVLLLRSRTASSENVPEGCWPHNIVPFIIEPGYKKYQIESIIDVVAEFNDYTCIRWVDGDKIPYNATQMVFFRWVYYGWTCGVLHSPEENAVLVQLGDECLERNMILHAMMHVLGFSHEHQRADRDCYVWVNEPYAIQIGELPSFIRKKPNPWLDRFPYDKYSIMHYPRSFGVQGKDKRSYTEEPLGTTDERLSYFDVWKILYRFCGFPHYCDVFPLICNLMDDLENDCIVP